MKKKRFGLVVAIVLAGLSLQAQDVFGPMRAAIKAGSAEQLSKHFNQKLDVDIEGNLNSFSKTQAVFALSEFFKAHPPTEFSIKHKGSSGGLQFAIGIYLSDQDTYSVLIRVKEVGSSQLIQQISIAKEKK